MKKFVTLSKKGCNETLVRISSAGAVLNVDGVSQSLYLGPMYEDDLGCGPMGISYACAENGAPSVQA